MSYLPSIPAATIRMMGHHDEKPQFSHLIEHVMPDASMEEKGEAQVNLDGFMDVMYRIFKRLEAEGKFPLPEDGSLTWPEDMQ